MDLKLKDKVAIVGGASQGIGFGIARTLAAEGVKLVITARREKPLREAAEKIRTETGLEPLALPSDCRRRGRGDRVSAAMPSKPFRHTIGVFSTLQFISLLVRRNAMRVV